MPGIVGLITTMPRERAESELRRMLAACRHESFHATGTWIDEHQGIYVGWTTRGDAGVRIPLANEREDVVLMFSGEEYSESRGKDDSYLVRLAEETDFPAGLNGRFHGLLADRKRGNVTLFNDRYGIHRLYYHEATDAVYFAAEAKAILAVRPELRTPDPRGLGEFVACGCVLENRTIFTGIHVLPPASAWAFRQRMLAHKGTYFQPREWEEQPRLRPDAFYEQFRDTFARILPRYFNGSDPVAMSLTGGLDTRMIMAWHKATPDSLPCYSFGGMFRDCQDVMLARQVAEVCRQPHHVIPVEDDFLSRFPHYAERAVYLTDGCIEVRHSPDLYVNEQARNIAPVRMTGNYGGEVLRRVRAFKPTEPAPGLFRPEFITYAHAARATYNEVTAGHPLSFALFRQTPWHHYGLLALEQTQVELRSPYLDNNLAKVLFQAPDSVVSNHDICLRLIADGSAALRQVRTDRGSGGNRGPLSTALLKAMLEFSFKAEYAYDYGMPQSIARVDHFLAPLRLERLFLGRHKFCHFRVWYRDRLSAYVREMLLDSRTLSRPYLEPNTLQAMVRSHIKGDRNYTTEIHKVLTLELQHRLFFDSH